MTTALQLQDDYSFEKWIIQNILLSKITNYKLQITLRLVGVSAQQLRG